VIREDLQAMRRRSARPQSFSEAQGSSARLPLSFAAGVAGFHKPMGDGRPGFFDTYVHRLPLGLVGPVWHAQQGAGHSV